MDSSGVQPATDASFAAAHRRLLETPGLQLDFPAAVAPPPPPEWLKAFGRFLGDYVAPLLKYVFWIGLAIIAAAVLFLIVREVANLRRPGRRGAAKRAAPVDWRPEPLKAKALLEDADRLAAAGRFEEAVHLLLHRSVDDLRSRRPDLVRPALTSRDIARIEAVPPTPREAFGRIAKAVERSFFGGGRIAAEEFAACRRAYEVFAFEGWA